MTAHDWTFDCHHDTWRCSGCGVMSPAIVERPRGECPGPPPSTWLPPGPDDAPVRPAITPEQSERDTMNERSYYEAMGAINSALTSLPFTAPEAVPHKLEQLMSGALELLRSFGYKVRPVEVVPESLTPVVGAEGGESSPVAQAEPTAGEEAGATSPAKASELEASAAINVYGCSSCPFLGYREAREEYPERSYYWCEQGASVDGFEHGGGAPETCPLREAPRLVQLATHLMAK